MQDCNQHLFRLYRWMSVNVVSIDIFTIAPRLLHDCKISEIRHHNLRRTSVPCCPFYKLILTPLLRSDMIILFTVVEDQRKVYIFEEKLKFSPMADLLRAKLNLSRDRVSYLVKIPPSSTPRDFDEWLLAKSHRNPIRTHSNKYTTGTPPARSIYI